MESIAITNIQELREEIARLRNEETEQKTLLAARFNSPIAIFGSVKSLFSRPGSTTPIGELHYPDILKIISRIAIPFTLNKTIFRHSNFLIKALVSLVSQKAAGMVSEKSVEGVFEKGKSLFEKIFHKSGASPQPNSGNLRPVYSETNLKTHVPNRSLPNGGESAGLL